jgi:hypothetical protein
MTSLSGFSDGETAIGALLAKPHGGEAALTRIIHQA